MSKALNFNTVKKRYFTVTLPDENKTTLLVGMPTKKIMDELILLKSSVEALEDDETNTEATDDLYTACAKIMSRNKTGAKITPEFLGEIFDIEDVLIFFQNYMGFLGEVTSSKN